MRQTNQSVDAEIAFKEVMLGKEFPLEVFVFDKLDCGSLRVLREVQTVSINLSAIAGGQNQLECLRFPEVFRAFTAQLSL